MNPFDYAHELITKENLDDGMVDRKDYKQFLLNRTISYHPDLIEYVNALNQFPDIKNKLHFDFFNTAVQKKKRSKKYWMKGKKLESLAIIKEYYKFSNRKCLEVLSVLSDKDIINIKDRLFKGGVS